MNLPEYLAPESFARAWAPEVPGPMQSPGPRHSPAPGAKEERPGSSGIPIAALMRAVWWSGDFHLNPATGQPGKVRKRPVPSAGGCYPVQLHVLCGDGCDVPKGRYVISSSTGGLRRLAYDDEVHHGAGSRQGVGNHRGTSGQPPEVGAVVVLTVLPQRTAAKYHHRTGPLLIADAAYAALALVHHASALSVGASWKILRPGPWPAFPQETALACVALGTSLPATGVAGVSTHQLARRRSADVFAPRTTPRTSPALDVRSMVAAAERGIVPPKPASCRMRLIDDAGLDDPLLAQHCAGQHWIRNLDALLIFETETLPDPDAMWWASATAAHCLYTALGTDVAIDFRPVGGWTSARGGWAALHGLGMLHQHTHHTNERAVHAGQ
ncbi:hypothetical protein FQP90_02315 [Paenarthrobacter nitroguajacolicus]|uniref:SagB/ThcOx family dehydrogenase n=1 Tax=Paenarthrobacter nitroguajacolicus TaxID=211146 RepID=A0A558HAS6_PAENT|nr:hypothetical protein [Paenarthrobacter nitroguajacolicus]TVU66232.1 hypothetical protein FQP90_02315 [Paenarthrobacter nitroguajacolicus]